jgi:hypothetical protein
VVISRTYNFYALGLSLGAILDITNPVDYIKALSQIMSEFERHTSDDSKQKMVISLTYESIVVHLIICHFIIEKYL